MRVRTETKLGASHTIGGRIIRLVEKRQIVSSGAGVFMSVLPLGILIAEEGCEYYYSLENAPEP